MPHLSNEVQNGISSREFHKTKAQYASHSSTVICNPPPPPPRHHEHTPYSTNIPSDSRFNRAAKYNAVSKIGACFRNKSPPHKRRQKRGGRVTRLSQKQIKSTVGNEHDGASDKQLNSSSSFSLQGGDDSSSNSSSSFIIRGLNPPLPDSKHTPLYHYWS